MNGNRQGLMKEVVVVAVLAALLLTVGGVLVRNVYVSLRAFDVAKVETSSLFDDLDKRLRTWLDGLFVTKPAAPAPPQPAAQPAQAGKEAKPAAAAKAEVRQVRFFEAGKDLPAIKDRAYSGQFSRQARHIYCEVTYKNNSYQVADSEIAVAVQAVNAAGQVIGERKGVIRPRKEWATANFTANWGNDDPGFWQPGQYTVKISFDGAPAGDYRFRVE